MNTTRGFRVMVLLAATGLTAPHVVQGQVVEQREAGFEVRREWMEQLRAYPFGEYTQNPVYAARAAVFGAASRAPAGAVAGAASSMMVPPSGATRPPSMFISVDFPAPFAPMMATACPGATVRLASAMA